MSKKPLTNGEIHNFYRYGRCHCGAKKWEREPFCAGCYRELSPETKESLRRKFGKGFETAFRVAVREIAGEKSEEIWFGVDKLTGELNIL